MSKKVRATASGFLGGRLYSAGDTFILSDERKFSKSWMEYTDPPDIKLSAAEAKAKAKAEKEAEKAAEAKAKEDAELAELERLEAEEKS